ncbi:MAG: hypothetical protein NDI84_13680, partial [Steroidobacteraceae bacterium]|nr:hypothetical protein [Steroidobacteraceae bacterium]
SDGQSRLLVTATVLKHASLKVLAQPAAVVITAEDIARGHVDVPAPALLAVKSNSGGYMLGFASEGDFMRRIIVAGTGSELELSPAGGLVTRTQPRGGTSSLVLTFRFVLSDTAQAGTYPWPLRLSVAPL